MAVPDLVASRAPAHCPGFVTDLVVRCGRGDATALARLLELFYAPVSAAVMQLAPGCAAEELTARVFVRLWHQAPTYQRRDQNAVDWVMGHVPIIMSSLSPDLEPAWLPSAPTTRRARPMATPARTSTTTLEPPSPPGRLSTKRRAS